MNGEHKKPVESRTEEQAAQTPLIEQLRSVPLNAHHFVEIGPTHHRNIPYGPWCHAAADQIDLLMRALVESVKLQAHYAGLLNMYDGGERIVFQNASEWLKRIQERT